ncbi:maleylpyruvate isomerase N-terminal domain-containing protein [Micromonospora sp. STR1_7]|uniref:Maleylpyruvate isomerase N-terminal domain-containing protein n=1 Tax=Micromonospora parastrephiae TaxID=2806101 RepID=A0ABS1Y0N4_9ACTN|nr:maleylpyruvate isomerase N-terminal domain-containing protein [Micromonospora parastrephiae]MBM0235079.1 maleylpyruvate isomerase N-terminal domain-containing protein [Micromonospora parastrephiae]
MSSTADQIITALRAGHEELAALVRDLKEDDLLRPSGASEWQVSQVLSHLGSGAEINLAALTAARTGAPAPDDDFNRGVWQHWDALPPAEHAAGFLAANERLVEAYESLDAGTRASLRIDLGFLPEPAATGRRPEGRASTRSPTRTQPRRYSSQVTFGDTTGPSSAARLARPLRPR